jgi:hypothetical protein
MDTKSKYSPGSDHSKTHQHLFPPLPSMPAPQPKPFHCYSHNLTTRPIRVHCEGCTRPMPCHYVQVVNSDKKVWICDECRTGTYVHPLDLIKHLHQLGYSRKARAQRLMEERNRNRKDGQQQTRL